jgi:hypothetical protein
VHDPPRAMRIDDGSGVHVTDYETNAELTPIPR